VHLFGLITLNEKGLVAITLQQALEFLAAYPCEDCWACDLIPIEMENREHCPVPDRVEKLIAMPAGCERPRLSFAIPNNTTGHKIRIVEDRPISVR
jgi:hypothetical protein